MGKIAIPVFAALLLAPAWATAAQELDALTGQFCVECHNTTDWAGGLDLTSLDHTRVAENAAEWEKVVLKLRAGMMPPPGEARPSPRDTLAVVRTLERQLDAASPAHAAAPALHRLNRSEYTNAIRDLFGITVDVTGLLPPDDASEGFDNVAAGLSISPALIQGYTTAAMKLARLAVGDISATETTTIYQAPRLLARDQRLAGLPLGSRGGMRVEHYFPLDAEYRISVRGNLAAFRGDVASFRADAANPRGPGSLVDVALDGRRINSGIPRDLRVRVPAGRHVLTVSQFDQGRSVGVNDIYAGAATERGIEAIEITGPYAATGPGDTESRRRIFSCLPRAAGEERGCAERIIVDIASQAFRAPQRLADLAVIMQFYQQGHAEGGFEAGIQQALSRILIDPRFLFRFEEEPDGGATGTTWAVTDLELASRLSFFLWSSIPDRRLTDLAAAGRLHRPEVLEAEVRRMLADPRAQALVDNFAGQWLYLRELAAVTPEVEGFDDTLREAFSGETRALVSWVLAQDRPLTELLTADYSFLNERLARHYGIPGVRGPQLRRVKLPADTHRRGLLGHGSVLTVTSTATRTSPVIRGAWILGNILGAPPPEPPPGVETNLDGDGSTVITTSVRARLEAHRQNPSCSGCHGMIDPVGFALENFNPIGAWRERDGDSLVDARGTLMDGTQIEGPDDLVAAIMARPELFVANVTQKLLTYALGRELDHRDMPTVRAIVREAEREQYRIGALIMGVVKSPAFRMRGRAAEPVHTAAR
jgi:hypothetical protein